MQMHKVQRVCISIHDDNKSKYLTFELQSFSLYTSMSISENASLCVEYVIKLMGVKTNRLDMLISSIYY